MVNQDPFLFVDAATAASARRQGIDPRELEEETQGVMEYLYTTLPGAPVSAAASLSALPVPDPSGADRLSVLPFAILRDIVSRLPTKDAARTAVLSRRWRPVWRATPLAFADAHLVPGFLEGRRQPTRADTPDIAAAVSRVLVSLHPGPFRAVHLTCCYNAGHPRHLARWVQALADKGVQDLVLVNRPWPRDMPLPAAIFGAAALTRLYLGVWKFPEPPVRPRSAGPLFPNLRELVLSSIDMDNRDIDFLLAACPVLEKFGIQGIRKEGIRVNLVGQRLRCAQISVSVTESIAVVDAPILERFLITGSMKLVNGSCVSVKIGKAPNLRVLGHLKPGTHMLEINNTVINAGIKPSPSTVVPSVKILGLAVCFGVRNDAKKLPSFLKCFPNVETLHILSEGADEAAGELDLKFWQEAGPIESIQSRIKEMTFREFRMSQNEVAFLKFVFQSAQVLKNAQIVVSRRRGKSRPLLVSDVKALIPDNGPSNSCHVLFCESSAPDAVLVGNFQRGFDFSVTDPFAGKLVLNV